MFAYWTRTVVVIWCMKEIDLDLWPLSVNRGGLIVQSLKIHTIFWSVFITKENMIINHNALLIFQRTQTAAVPCLHQTLPSSLPSQKAAVALRPLRHSTPLTSTPQWMVSFLNTDASTQRARMYPLTSTSRKNLMTSTKADHLQVLFLTFFFCWILHRTKCVVLII